jgi:hypothetical protein
MSEHGFYKRVSWRVEKMRRKVHKAKQKLTKRERLLEKYISQNREDKLPMFNNGKDISRPLNAMRLAQYRKCPDCLQNPVVTICFLIKSGVQKEVGVCRKHWNSLADSNIGWSGIPEAKKNCKLEVSQH